MSRLPEITKRIAIAEITIAVSCMVSMAFYRSNRTFSLDEKTGYVRYWIPGCTLVMAIFTVYLARRTSRRSPDKKALHLTIGVFVIIGQSPAIITGGMDMDSAFETPYWRVPYSNGSRAAVCINMAGHFVNFVLLIASVSLMQKLPSTTISGGGRRNRNTYTPSFNVQDQASALRRYHQISTLSATIDNALLAEMEQTRGVCGNATPATGRTTSNHRQQASETAAGVRRSPRAGIDASGPLNGSFNHALRRDATHQFVPPRQTQFGETSAQTDPPPPSYREGPLFPHSSLPPSYGEHRTFSWPAQDDSVPPPSYEEATQPL